MANGLLLAKVGLTNPALAAKYLLANLDVDTIVKNTKEASQVTALNGLEEQVDAVGGGLFRIEFKFGIMALILGLAAGFLALAFSNASTREQHKSSIIWKVIGIIGFGAAATGVALLVKVGVDFFSTTK
jgi:hypothetical protein